MRTRRIIMLEVAKYYQRMENRKREKRKAEEKEAEAQKEWGEPPKKKKKTDS